MIKTVFKSAIIKTDLPNHFPIVFALYTDETAQKPDKRFYCEKKIEKLINFLHNRNLEDIKKIEDPENHANTFLTSLLPFMKSRFPIRKLKFNS